MSRSFVSPRGCAQFLVTFVLPLFAGHLVGGAFAAEAPPPPIIKQVDLLLSGHVIGLFPRDKDLSVGGSPIANTDVRGTIGAGVKVDLHPSFTNKLVGLEIEMFGLGGSVRAPRTTTGSGATQAQGSLIAVSTMYNTMLRYPRDRIQPYLGVGAGSSTGSLYGTNIQSGNMAATGNSGDWGFASQFLGGMRGFRSFDHSCMPTATNDGHLVPMGTLFVKLKNHDS